MSGTARPKMGLKAGWVTGESGWGEGGFNPNFEILDSLGSIHIINQYPLSSPPSSPADGDVYYTDTSYVDGAWAGQFGKLAIRVRSTWVFVEPQKGWLATVGENPPLPCYYDPDLGAAQFRWRRITPDRLTPQIIPIYIPGTPAANSIPWRMFMPGSTFPGRSSTPNRKIAAISQMMPYTYPSASTTINLRVRGMYNLSFVTTIGSFVLPSTRNNAFFQPVSDGEIGGDGIFLELQMPSNLNGLADLCFTLILEGSEPLYEAAQPAL